MSAPQLPRDPITIFVMSHEDLNLLRLCLRALLRRTHYPHELIVVDNGSVDPHLIRYLNKVSSLTRIKVYRNKYNLWVLGLHQAVLDWCRKHGSASRFVLTDCDIIPPLPRQGRCWLTELSRLLDNNPHVGKIGLSLDLGYIKNRPFFAHTYQREQFFMGGPRLGELIVAPVDTTIAIYRRDLFVTKDPWFIPTHQGLYRPYYYCCRTSDIKAKHLSWRFYDKRKESQMTRKLICFGLLGATIVPAALANSPLMARWFYQMVRPIARLAWGSLALWLQLVFFVKCLPRNTNMIQSSRRA